MLCNDVNNIIFWFYVVVLEDEKFFNEVFFKVEIFFWMFEKRKFDLSEFKFDEFESVLGIVENKCDELSVCVSCKCEKLG